MRRTATAGLLLLGLCQTALAGSIYWTDETLGTIYRANSDGSGISSVITGDIPPQGLALDQTTGTLYWSDYRTDTIHSVNTDGLGAMDLVTVAGEPRGVAVDPSSGQVYWCRYGGGYPAIQRANFNGTGLETLVPSTDAYGPLGIDLDPSAGKMYWTDYTRGRIVRANLDGSDVEEVLAGLSAPFMLDVVPGLGKVYWTEGSLVRRSNLDGTGVENLLAGLVQGRGIAVDEQAGVFYVVDNGARSIIRANLDGGHAEAIVVTGVFPTGVAIELTGVAVPLPLAAWGGGTLLLLLAGCRRLRRR